GQFIPRSLHHRVRLRSYGSSRPQSCAVPPPAWHTMKLADSARATISPGLLRQTLPEQREKLDRLDLTVATIAARRDCASASSPRFHAVIALPRSRESEPWVFFLMNGASPPVATFVPLSALEKLTNLSSTICANERESQPVKNIENWPPRPMWLPQPVVMSARFGPSGTGGSSSSVAWKRRGWGPTLQSAWSPNGASSKWCCCVAPKKSALVSTTETR